MLSDEVVDKVVERLVNRIEQVNRYTLLQIAKKIKQIYKLTPTEANQLVNVLKYGGDYEKVVKQLQDITKLNIKEIEKIFDEVAKNDYRFAKQFYDYRKKKYIPFEQNLELQYHINAIKKLTQQKYIDLSRTKALGFTVKNKKGEVVFKGLKQTYNEAIDKAVISVVQGKDTFYNQMHQILKDIAVSGLKTIDYKSGKSMRLDSAIKTHMEDAIKQLHNEVQKEIGKQFDSDGVEITVHLNPAPDHEEVQGKQFSNKEFKKFQTDKKAISYDNIVFEPKYNGYDRRSISEYNCKHYTFSIILGVNIPQYSNEQLKEIINKNNKGFEFEGKHYTNYEGTQLQRKIERDVRHQKDLQIFGIESGDKQLIQESQDKIKILNKKYKQLTEASTLPTKLQRMRVSNYKRYNTKNNNIEIEYARKNNIIWHSTENLEEMVNSNKMISPSISVAKDFSSKVKYGSQFIEFKPELLENVNKNTSLFIGDGGNKYTKKAEQFDSLMGMLKDNPQYYNELKFDNNLQFIKYVKKVHVRQDEPKRVLKLLKQNNIEYEIYNDKRVRGFAKKK